jgi:hypothetical protein
MTEGAFYLAEAIDRMRDPSARFASLGMTGVSPYEYKYSS